MSKIFLLSAMAISSFALGIYLFISKTEFFDQRHYAEPTVFDDELNSRLSHHLETGISYDPFAVESDGSTHEEQNSENVLGDFVDIGKGETITGILSRSHIDNAEIYRLAEAMRPHLRLRDLSPGDQYRLRLNASASGTPVIDEFVIKKLTPNHTYVFYTARRSSDGSDSHFIVDSRAADVEERISPMRIRVDRNLFQTFNAVPFGNELMQRLIAIFAWRMRIPRDVASTDEIELLVTEKHSLGTMVGYGKIMMAIYKRHSEVLFAIYFSSQDNRVSGYFDRQGKSIEKEFAYSPVHELTETSSQKYRLHPVKKIRMRHNGTDYRGSVGTEFFSIADGRVTERGFDREVGNMIRIRHSYGIHSEYFHADTLENLSVGTRVTRGQKLGTIGRTGRLCTGPHLHMGLYRMLGKKRTYLELSSLRDVLKPAGDIPIQYMIEFNAKVKEFYAILQEEKGSTVAIAE